LGSGQNRWILVEFIPIVQGTAQLGKYTVGSANAIDGKAIWSALKQSVLNNFGETGWGAVGLSLTGTQDFASTSLLRGPDQIAVFLNLQSNISLLRRTFALFEWLETNTTSPGER